MKLSNLFNNFLGKWRTLSVPKRFAWLSLIAFIIIVVIRIATEGLANPILDPFIVNAATIIALLMTVIGFLYPEKPPASLPVVPPPEPLTSSISGYDQDIFVSFAPADKEWATNLVNTLQNGPLKVRVSKLGHCSVWMADEAGQALDILEHTATLLLVLSPDWVTSSDCHKVLQTFLQCHHDLSRVVVVTRQPVDLPAELQGCQVYRFWDSPGYKPASVEERRFRDQIVTLATDLANKLKELLHPAAPPKITVFLAEVTDDLEDSRDQLKSRLEQEGCRVLPQGTALFAEHPETRWQADLAQASVFIQLLSHLPGKQHFPRLQYQAAQTAKVTHILQWRDKQLHVDQVTDPQQKTLLESDTVMAIGIEEFRREVLRVIKPQEEPPTDTHLLAQPIFVNTSPEDENFGKQIIQLLDKHKVHGTVPLYQGKPTQIRKDIKAKMSFCRAMVLVYGQTGLEWVNTQHRDFNQTCKHSGNTCLPPLALCHLPENPEFVTSGISKFSCTGNLEQDLSRFLNQYQLKSHA